MDGRGFRNPPVQVGEEIDVKIEAVGEKGDGIAKQNGFVLFVPGVKEGDEVRIKITKVLRKVGFAEVIGSAQGKVEESQPAEEPTAEEGAVEDAPAEEQPAESAQDTEDFGEDLEEKKE
jgi:predicted RNA-binding protein with TRAM domain